VPRYFFNMVDGSSRNLVKDSDGAEFLDLNEARKEAVGLARDVARHGFQGSAIWQVVVTDESGREVLTIPLSEIRAPRIWLDLGRTIAHLGARFGTRAFVWLVVVAVLAVIVLAAIAPFRGREQGATYRTASAPTEEAVVAVRFVADAHAADITEFLETYRASVVGGPRPGGFYRLSLTDKALPQEELAKTVGRMTREKIVEFAAIVP
jgi:Domain of unknown function (DUF6894)